MAQFDKSPARAHYDVIIIGGAMMGASTAWFLSDLEDFDGSVLVVEMDPSYSQCSTGHTNSCVRQQFSEELNIQISQFTAEFVKNLREFMGGDEEVPELSIHNFGYMYLADNEDFADVLRDNQKVQIANGAETRLLTANQIADEYPFYNVDDIVLGAINTKDEGYWDGGTVFDWWRKSARRRGVEYISNKVVGLGKSGSGRAVESVTLETGEVIGCGKLVNATGPRAVEMCKLLGFEIPVEPRKRFTWIFQSEEPLGQDLPLTIDPSGIHVRQDGTDYFLAGGHTEYDPAADYDDFEMDHAFWQDHVWPTLATRVPKFEAIKVTNEWAGHYAYNVFDQNAIIGPHPEIANFYFINGFSGHGLQQSPAMGRGVAELITHGEYRTLDLSRFGYDRLVEDRPIIEKAVI